MESPHEMEAMEPEEWPPQEVATWIRSLAEPAASLADTLLDARVDGETLLKLTAADLESEEFDIDATAAAALIDAIARDLVGAPASQGAGCADSEALGRFADFAGQLADIAGDVIRPLFRKGLDVVDKAAGYPPAEGPANVGSDAAADRVDPVTIADRNAEAAMRKRIHETFPDHGIIGEEGGEENASAEYVWVLDPIDGTKSFMTGTYGFGVLICLCHKKEPIVGILDQPVLKERWVGVWGRPTTLNGVPVRTRHCPKLDGARLMTHDPFSKQLRRDPQTLAAYERLAGSVQVRRYSQDCYAYGLVAAGHVDIVVEARQAPWDFLALCPIVIGAGGMVCDWKGAPLQLSNDKPDVLACGCLSLLPDVLEVLKPKAI